MKAIIDGLIVLPNEIINGHVIMYEKDIWRIVPRKQFRAGMCSEFIDGNGGFVVPGFINEHIHGCAGADTMDDDVQALKTMQQALPATGVTSFVPTTMTMEQGRIEKALSRIRQARDDYQGGAQVLGAHMEGYWQSRRGQNTPIHRTWYRSMPAMRANIIHKLSRINS